MDLTRFLYRVNLSLLLEFEGSPVTEPKEIISQHEKQLMIIPTGCNELILMFVFQVVYLIFRRVTIASLCKLPQFCIVDFLLLVY